VSTLKNRPVKNPNSEGSDHLHPGQRLAGEKTGYQAGGVKSETKPEQTSNRRQEIG
jgi:hypothetical protein